MNPEHVLAILTSLADPGRLAGMARYGIDTSKALGVSIPDLRRTAKELKRHAEDRHALALGLWDTGVHEARILAAMVEDPAACGEAQMDAWAGDFGSWDLCDQCCLNLFALHPAAWDKVAAWSDRQEEFVRRAAFALAACLAVKAKKAPDAAFARILPLCEQASADPRNYVKKAVSWALRQTGKRNRALNAMAIQTAERIATQDEPAARWIARDVLKELNDPAVLARIKG